MLRTVLRRVSLVAVWALATAAGVSAVALQTRTGREAVVEAAARFVSSRINGALTIGSVDGAWLTGLELRDVRLVDENGRPFVTIAAARLRYRLSQLLTGGIVLNGITLDGLEVEFMQPEPGGPFNVDLIFAGDSRDTTAPRLVVLRNVRLDNATIKITTPAQRGDPTVVEREEGPSGYMRVRRITGINARLPYVRFRLPNPDERPVLVEIDSLAARLNDPNLVLTDAVGSAEVFGDSVVLDLREVALPRTRGAVLGTLSWPDGKLTFDLTIRAAELATNDVTGLVRDVPRGLQGSGVIAVRSLSRDMLSLEVEDMNLTGSGGGGRVQGRFGMVFGPGDRWAQRSTNLTLTRFDLEYVRHLLDTLPVAGRVTGNVSADGPRDRMRLAVDVTFHDSLVGDWPATHLRGQGVVSLGVPGDFVFRDFVLNSADISLETVRLLIPGIGLVGRISGSGELSGPWLQVTYRGELRHRDSPLPESRAQGRFRIDATGDSVGLWAELELDSLRLEGLHTSFPGLSATSVLAGHVSLAGFLDSLVTDASLEGPAGAVRLVGPLMLGQARSGAHAFELHVRDLDLSAYLPTLPRSRLTGSMRGAAWRGEGGATFDATVALGASNVSGTPLDSVLGSVSWSDSVVVFDSVRMWGPLFQAGIDGVVGNSSPGRESARFSARVDSLGAIEPWIEALLPPLPEDAAPASGSVWVNGEVSGTVDAFVVIADLLAVDVRRGGLYLGSLGGAGTWASAGRSIRIQAEADTVQFRTLGLGQLSILLRGPPDSLDWEGASRLQDGGAWQGGGRWRVLAGGNVLEVDSLNVDLASGSWAMDSAIAIIADSGVTLAGVVVESDSGAGRVTLEGRLPFEGPGRLTGSIEAFPIVDLWQLLGRPHREVAGELSGTLSLWGTARAPLMEASLALRDGVFGEFRAPQTTGVFRYRDRQVSGDLELRRLGNPVLQVDVALPFDLSIGDVENRRLPGTLSIQARADSVDLTLFNAVTPLVRDAAGTLDADLGIIGTWEEPELTGRATLRDGTALFPSIGVRYTSANGELEFSGDTVHVRSLSIESGDGTMQVGGYVRLDELSRPLLALQIEADEFRAIDVRGFLTLSASGEVQLEGPVFGATLTGRATATEGVLYFADLVTKEVVNLEDTLFREIVDTALLRREGLGTAFENRFLASLRIDSLQLGIGEDVWLRSTEANIQLIGSVTVDKELDRYRVNGILTAPRGTYRLQLLPTVARDFTVTQGRVLYLGTPDLDADLDIEAEHMVRTGREQDVTVMVKIGGTLYEPKLTLSSDIRPQLSESEIVSYLLFGSANLDPSQMQASEFVSGQLYGALSGQLESMVISDIGLPLDYFQIRPAARGGVFAGTEIELGKQVNILGTSAFLTARPRFLSCPREAHSGLYFGGSLDFRLSRRWLISASVEPTRSCQSFATQTTDPYQFGIDLFWETSY